MANEIKLWHQNENLSVDFVNNIPIEILNIALGNPLKLINCDVQGDVNVLGIAARISLELCQYFVKAARLRI